jgi:hypothetical protein
MGRRTLERQRELIRELLRADPNRSMRSIAREIGCGTSTVIRTRERYVSQDIYDGTPGTGHPGAENLRPAGPGNLRASTHGAYSALRREPLEDVHRAALQERFPHAPDDLAIAMATRLAMVDLFRAWVDEHGPMVDKRKESPAARELRLLINDHERASLVLAEIERQAGALDPLAALAAHTAKLNGGSDGA